MFEILTFYEFAEAGEGPETGCRRDVVGAVPYKCTADGFVKM